MAGLSWECLLWKRHHRNTLKNLLKHRNTGASSDKRFSPQQVGNTNMVGPTETVAEGASTPYMNWNPLGLHPEEARAEVEKIINKADLVLKHLLHWCDMLVCSCCACSASVSFCFPRARAPEVCHSVPSRSTGHSQGLQTQHQPPSLTFSPSDKQNPPKSCHGSGTIQQ